MEHIITIAEIDEVGQKEGSPLKIEKRNTCYYPEYCKILNKLRSCLWQIINILF